MKKNLPFLISFLFLCFSSLSVTPSARAESAANEVHSNDSNDRQSSGQPFFTWDNATVYFLLTDRFYNANTANDLAYGRKKDAAPLRGFMGGDLAGITAKIKEGYFNRLGVDAIWLTPPVEQIHGATDEGSGKSYGFHGYWARDFTSVDANLGTEADMRELVDTAHAHGIRILLDIVMNHVGPQADKDALWPDSWVRHAPVCTYKDVASTVSCTLVQGLPDIRTDSNEATPLPPFLIAKWKAEGRYAKEISELDQFFQRTGYPRAPRYYLMKWHTDWIRKYGIDGFRADTVKHVEPGVWKELKQLASSAYEEWKTANPQKKIGDTPFFMTAEVYGYSIAAGQKFTMDGGSHVNFYQNGFDNLINFGFKSDAKKDREALFSEYSARLHGDLQGYSVLNYISSHDDSAPFDLHRQQPLEAATRLLLSPGAAQIYYGDETARDIDVKEAQGDARLRSFMNWDALTTNAKRGNYRIADVLAHWQKLASFRRLHPAVGAGIHQKISDHPYTFKRTYDGHGQHDKVVVALDLPAHQDNPIAVTGVFADGQRLRDHYSGKTAIVVNGSVTFASHLPIALIAQDAP